MFSIRLHMFKIPKNIEYFMGLCRYFIDLGFKSAVWWAIILLMKDAEILISEAFEGGGSFCGAAAFLSS